MNSEIETAIEISTWTRCMDHVRNNRIEYLLLTGILHILGATNAAYEHVSGVCI